jgi:hypothetical protein
MKSAAALLASGAIVAACAAAFAAGTPWLRLHPLEGPTDPLVEVDVTSIQEGQRGPEATVRVSRTDLLRHPGSDLAYRSLLMHLRFDCEGEKTQLLSVSFFGGARGEGATLGRRTPGSEATARNLLAQLPYPALRALFRAACARDAGEGQ